MTEFGWRVLIGVVSSLLTGAILWTFRYSRERFRRRFAKITYFRVIRLRFKDRGDAPYYKRKHHTVADLTEDVYDEVWALNGAQCNVPVKLEQVKLTSSGVVDAVQILPILSKDADNHPHTKERPDEFTFSHPKATDKLAAVGTMINGLQSEENWWFGTTAQHDNQSLLLVADFSSLPYTTTPIRNPQYHVYRDTKELDKKQFIDAGRWHSESINDDIFYLRYSKAKKGDVIKITFSVDRDAVPKMRGKRPKPSKAEQDAAEQPTTPS